MKIPASQFGDFRFDLHMAGVHESSVFPDLDGLAGRIKWDETYYKDEPIARWP